MFLIRTVVYGDLHFNNLCGSHRRVNVGCISSFDGKKTLVFKLSVCPDILLSSGRHLSPSIIHLLVAGSSLSEYVHVVHVAEFQWIWCFVCKWCSVMGLLTTIFPVTCYGFYHWLFITTNVKHTPWLVNYLFTICPWVTKASVRSKPCVPLSKRLYFLPHSLQN